MSDATVAKPKRVPSPAQREAQRKFMARYAPPPHEKYLGPRYVDQALVGRLLYHRRLGVLLEYRWSAAGEEGETVHGGVLVRRGPGVGVALEVNGEPAEWACAANRLSVVEQSGEAEVGR